MDVYNSFINTLDSEIIKLLSIRQNYKLNSNFSITVLSNFFLLINMVIFN